MLVQVPTSTVLTLALGHVEQAAADDGHGFVLRQWQRNRPRPYLREADRPRPNLGTTQLHRLRVAMETGLTARETGLAVLPARGKALTGL